MDVGGGSRYIMKVVVISGSPRKEAKTQVIMKYVYEYAKAKNQDTKLINLSEGLVECYRGPGEEYNEATIAAAKDTTDADVWLIGSPVYNSFFSSALKNLFEYINYKKTAGKVAGMAILGSGEISFTQVQALITQMMSYFRVVTNPTAVFVTAESITDDAVSDTDTQARLREMVDKTLDIASKVRQ